MSNTINSAQYLTQRLAGLTASRLETNSPSNFSTQNIPPSQSAFSIKSGDYGNLLLRDTISRSAELVGVVQVAREDLDNIANYLVDILSRVDVLNSLSVNDPARQTTNDEIHDLEIGLSNYLGSRTTQTPDVAIKYSPLENLTERYFETSIANTQFPQLAYNEIAALEIDFSAMFASVHSSETCPICAVAKGDVNTEAPLLAAPTTNSTNVTFAVGTQSSGVSYIETLRMGNKWDLTAGETLSYSYYDSNSAVPYVGYPAGGVDPPAAVSSLIAFQSSLDSAFNLWDQSSALTLEKVVEAGTAVGEMRVAYTDNTQTPAGSAAYAFGPGNSTVSGDIWFDRTQSSNQAFTQGDYGFMTALHEIGHALGLSHPFDGGSATQATLAANDDNLRNTLMSYTNTDRNLVLTVADNGQGGWTANFSTGVYASTPMLYDVKTVEFLYGDSTTTRTTDSTYSWSASPRIIETIVDSGGVDTIDASNQTRTNIINLNSGSFSSICYWSQADQLSYYQSQYGGNTSVTLQNYITSTNTAYNVSDVLYTGADNIAIAYSAVIENAVGGSAADTIIGNSVNNRLKGNAGNDSLTGGGGTDTAVFTGNYANYTITQSGGSWTVQDNVGTEGLDTVTGVQYLEFADLTWDLTTGASTTPPAGGGGSTASSDTSYRRYVGATRNNSLTNDGLTAKISSSKESILNAAPSNAISGSAGADILVGSEGDDVLAGGAGDDDVHAGAGNDLIVGGNGEGNDIYVGDSGEDTIKYSSARSGIVVNLEMGVAGSQGGGDAAGIGIDVLAEIENIIASHHDDYLVGNAANNKIAGNGGNDIIDGGAGLDTAVFDGARNSYKIATVSGGYVIRGAGQSAYVTSVEQLQFSDGVYDLINSQLTPSTLTGVGTSKQVDISTQAGASKAIDAFDKALAYVNLQRASLGAVMNVLEHRVNVMTTERTNTKQSYSRIKDTDYAHETAALAKQMILQQAGQAMLAMANQSSSNVMALLK
jgi:flagellin-like hook-associated protein FlgL